MKAQDSFDILISERHNHEEAQHFCPEELNECKPII